MTGTIVYYDPGQLPNSITHKFPLLGLNAEYSLNSFQNLYAGISQSYRPVLFKDIIPTTTYDVVDKDLKDAFGYTIELGYRGRAANFNWDIGAFQMQYNNRMGTLAEFDSHGNFYQYRTNIGNSHTRGAELFIEYLTTVGKLDISAFTSTGLFNARYSDAVVRSGESNVDVSGNKVESVPDVITRNGITFRFMKVSVGLLYSYTAESFADALNTVEPVANGSVGLVPSYGLLDVNASLALTKNLIFKVNVNNITDKQYFTKRPQFYPGPGVWSSDGRSITASIGFKI
jgi:Fe(3+) dicitrate transport protein